MRYTLFFLMAFLFCANVFAEEKSPVFSEASALNHEETVKNSIRQDKKLHVVKLHRIRRDDEEFSPKILIISFDKAVGKEELYKAVAEYGAKIKYDYHLINAMAIEKPEDKSLDETILYFKQVKGVLSVSRDRIMHLHGPLKVQN